ncbi:antirestriction protein ArdC [Palleronia aestuarii]|uniref:Antirestriction protein ArdC n=1 Tax=Palleronia aestuarii TaxID=568105 RepID=A0A2W7N7Q9_9RHOB|nr:zincin-like metallopeptidase domain-containing protein [Palleronia aestuarii]PZX14227.1 antirestriction protein ArdC [Palleronia aestuarii]
MATKQKFDPAAEITQEIIALLEKGTMPWRRPWKIAGGGVPLRHNGERYKGINAFLLGLRAAMMGYSSPYWMTFNQARDLDACVRKGSRSSIVVYYGTGRKRGSEAGSGDGDGSGEDGKEGGGSYRFLKSYRVFHVSQIDGLNASYHPEPEGDPSDGPTMDPDAQAFFDAIDIDVRYGGDRACYVPSVDQVWMPPLSRFETAGGFVSTLTHELCHATKAKHRLDRSFGVSSFGNEAYAREELVACVGEALMGQRMGFYADHIDNHAAYIASWIKVLKSDTRFLFTAAAHAQRAVDFLVAASESGAKAKEAIHEAA